MVVVTTTGELAAEMTGWSGNADGGNRASAAIVAACHCTGSPGSADGILHFREGGGVEDDKPRAALLSLW